MSKILEKVVSRKVTTVIAGGTMLLAMLVGCGGAASSSSTSGSIAGMKDNGDGTYTVTVAVLDGMAPYTFTDEKGEMKGFDYEWMKAVDEKLDKYQFEYVSVSADAAPAAIQAGTYAMSASAHFITPARMENYLLSVPESYYPVNLISRKADSFTSFEDLDGKALVPNPPNDGLSIVLGDMAQKYPDVKYTQEPTSEYIPYLDGLQDVVKGRYDCWFGGKSMYDDLVAANDALGEETFCSDAITTAACVAVINSSLTEFREAVNEATCALYVDGTLKTLSEKWLGEDYFKVAEETGSLFDYEGYSAEQAEWYKK